jgi:hypothetical protein
MQRRHIESHARLPPMRSQFKADLGLETLSRADRVLIDQASLLALRAQQMRDGILSGDAAVCHFQETRRATSTADKENAIEAVVAFLTNARRKRAKRRRKEAKLRRGAAICVTDRDPTNSPCACKPCVARDRGRLSNSVIEKGRSVAISKPTARQFLASSFNSPTICGLAAAAMIGVGKRFSLSASLAACSASWLFLSPTVVASLAALS